MIVLTGGAFDLLHLAHIKWLERVALFGDLTVNIASDEQIRKKKGKDRPILSQEHRAETVKALKCVKDVYLMEGLYNIDKILDDVKPDILVLNEGVDNSKEKKACNKRGIQLIEIPRVITGLDTSKIINNIRSLKGV